MRSPRRSRAGLLVGRLLLARLALSFRGRGARSLPLLLLDRALDLLLVELESGAIGALGLAARLLVLRRLQGDDGAGEQRDRGFLREPLVSQALEELQLLVREQIELRDLERGGRGRDVREAELEDAHAPLVLDRLELLAHLRAQPVDLGH